VLELEERNGFWFAMREALPLVTTPYLIVVQHDRTFLRGDAAPLQQLQQQQQQHQALGRGGSTSESEHGRGLGAG
jgi:hypothetical protein